MISFLDLYGVTQKYAEEIHSAAQRVIDSGWFLMGNELMSFEKQYSHYIGTNYCVGVANGLDALRLILRAYIELGFMKAGDEILVPANTYIASVLAITDNRLTPVFIEPNIDTYEIDENRIEEAISFRTKAIMIVHLYGKCAYTEKIGEICLKYGLKLIEDNAQAHGCLFRDKRTGALGDAAGHSFYPSKNLGALGDAGAVTSNDEALIDVVRTLAYYGSRKRYIFEYTGYNSRLDEIQAAILSVKLNHLDEDNNHRKEMARLYLENINNPEIMLPIVDDWDANVFHVFPVRCGRRDELQKYLEDNGVQTLIHYPIPPHKQRCYPQYNHLSFPVTEQIHREELSLPLSQVITGNEIVYISRMISKFC